MLRSSVIVSRVTSRNFHGTILRRQSDKSEQVEATDPTAAEFLKKRPKGALIPPIGVDSLTLADHREQLQDQFKDDDVPTVAHEMLREQRQVLYYMRLIEHEMPKLVAFRKPFVVPTDETPIVVRSINYAGEEHPATNKRVIVVAVDKLPLKDEDAIHKIKLLAGPRWTPRPPADAGVSQMEGWGNGYIKISCEDFPKPAMNLKWASDTLDRLITEANNTHADKFREVPLDLRHIISKAKKHKKGEHLRHRVYNRPSIHDFPKEWLPNLS